MPDSLYKDPLLFPSFPTIYGDKEKARLTDITKQKTAMEQVYAQKFTPEKWAKTSPIEKNIRNQFQSWDSWMKAIPKAITPTSWGIDYGATPEAASKELSAVDIEYNDLTRRELVTNLLPDVQSSMVMAARSGKPMQSISEILPEGIRGNFTLPEQDYLMGIATKLLESTPEQLKSNDYVNDIIGVGKSTTPAGYMDTLEAMPQITPNQVMSSVAFSKDLSDIGETLKLAFPPEFTERNMPEEPVPTDTKEDIHTNLIAKADSLDVEILANMSDRDLIGAINDKIAQGTGQLVNFKDATSGEYFTTRLRNGNEIWQMDDKGVDRFYGFYDATKDNIATPYQDNEKVVIDGKESTFKDLVDSFRVSGTEAVNSSINLFVDTLPQNILKPQSKNIFGRFVQDLIPFMPSSWVNAMFPPDKANFQSGSVEAYNNYTAGLRETFTDIYVNRQKGHEVWLEEHPELQARVDWTETGVHFDSPAWIANKVVSILPISLAALGTGIIAGSATGGNPLVGALAAGAVMFPSQTQDVKEALVANGASDTDASQMALPIGAIITALESVGEIPVMRAVVPTVMKAFSKEVISETTKLTLQQMAVKGLVTFTQVEVMETATEVMQQAVQNAAVKVFNPNQSIWQDVPQIALDTAVGVLPFSMLGMSSSFKQVKTRLPPAMASQAEAEVLTLVEMNVPEDVANTMVYGKLVSTLEGVIEVKKAIAELDAEVPVTVDTIIPVPQDIADKIAKNETLTPEEEQVRVNNKEEVENILKATKKVTPVVPNQEVTPIPKTRKPRVTKPKVDVVATKKKVKALTTNLTNAKDKIKEAESVLATLQESIKVAEKHAKTGNIGIQIDEESPLTKLKANEVEIKAKLEELVSEKERYIADLGIMHDAIASVPVEAVPLIPTPEIIPEPIVPTVDNTVSPTVSTVSSTAVDTGVSTEVIAYDEFEASGKFNTDPAFIKVKTEALTTYPKTKGAWLVQTFDSDSNLIGVVAQAKTKEAAIKKATAWEAKAKEVVAPVATPVAETPTPSVEPVAVAKPVTNKNLKNISEMLQDETIRETYPELQELSKQESNAIDNMGRIQTKGGSGANYAAIRDKVQVKLRELQQIIAREYPELAYIETTSVPKPVSLSKALADMWDNGMGIEARAARVQELGMSPELIMINWSGLTKEQQYQLANGKAEAKVAPEVKQPSVDLSGEVASTESLETIDGKEVMTDKEGRTIICE
jgi:hypothetical protein